MIIDLELGKEVFLNKRALAWARIQDEQ